MPDILMQILSFSVLLLLFASVKHYSRRSKLPPEAWILLLGIAYGLIKKEGEFDDWPDFALDPNAILFFFLPLLIYASARHFNIQHLRASWMPILLFALPGVLVNRAAFIDGSIFKELTKNLIGCNLS